MNTGLPFTVGRERELAALANLATTVTSGSFAAVTLIGEPGIGKSHLITIAVETARNAGMRVASGLGQEGAGAFPAQPLVDALVDLARSLAGQHPDSAPVADIEKVMRSLSRSVVNASGSDRALPEIVRILETFLRDLAHQNGLLIVIDDLQWADGATIELIRRLCVRLRDDAVGLILACRSSDLKGRPDINALLLSLQRLGSHTELHLNRMSDTEIVEVANAEVLGSLDGALQTWLIRTSDGNPFYAIELMIAALRSDTIGLQFDIWKLRGSVPLPANIGRLVDERMRVLPKQDRYLLQLASLLGRRFDLNLLSELTIRTMQSIYEALDEAVDLQLIQYIGDTEAMFAHDLQREAIAKTVPRGTQHQMHGQIAAALLARSEIGDSIEPSLLAFHFERAGDRPQAIRWALTAGQDALDAQSPDLAHTILEKALALLGSRGSPDRGQILLLAGIAAQRTGDERAATGHFIAARTWANTQMDQRLAAESGYRLGLTLWRQEKLDRAWSAFKRALSDYGDHEDGVVVALLSDMATFAGSNRHDPETGVRYAELADEIAHRLNEPRSCIRAETALGNLQARYVSPARGIETLTSALTDAEALDDPLLAAECSARLALACFWAGDLNLSRLAAERRLYHAERAHDPFELRHIFIWFAMLDAQQGEWESATRWLDRAEPIVAALDSPEPRAWLTFCRGMTEFTQGRYQEARELLRQAVEIFGAISPDTAIWYVGPYIESIWLTGDQYQARVVAGQFAAQLRALPAAAVPPEAVVYLASIALIMDEPELQDFAESLLASSIIVFADRLRDRLRAEIALRRGDLDQAAALLDAADDVALRAGIVIEQSPLLVARATLLEAQGADPQSVAALRQAAFDLLASAQQSEAVAPRVESGQLLSPREREVIRLVAKGQSNREIGATLSISDKTVERHLTNLYTKLDVGNRAAAAAWAVNAGLID